MDAQELRSRLLEIAGVKQVVRVEQVVSRGPGIVLSERACWIDGEDCPYGRPGGRFLERPIRSCVPRTDNKTGCLKLNENLDDLEDLMREEVRESIEEGVSEKVSKATTSVSSELFALADDATDEQVKKTLKLAAELIKEEEGIEDRKIVLLEDLEIE